MHKLKLKPLPLALACLLAPLPVCQAIAQSASAPVEIPLDVIQESGGGISADRLGIMIGVNGATPEEYIFDTGSTAFNIDVGSGTTGQPWFPMIPGVAVNPTFPAFTLYGDGTYGNLGANTTVGSIQFYSSTNNSIAASFTNNQGLPVLINQGNVATAASLNGDQQGAQVGWFLPAYGYAFTNAEIAAFNLNTTGEVPVYLDATWQQNLNAGIGPEDGGGYNLFGIFGAGEFGSDSVLGNLTTSGYIVAANNQRGNPQSCSGCAHVILNLTPALRAQFISLVPWNGGAAGTFPLSGAPVSANQFDLDFVYTLNGGKYSTTLQTLLDSGTPTIYLNDQGLLTEETNAGHVDAYGNEIPGITLTMTGAAPGTQPTSILTGNDSTGDQSNVVTPGPNGFTNQGQALYGISFFFNNSVMYDLQNQLTGYSPFFVSIDPISTSGQGYVVTNSVAPQGIAGVISGSGPFIVNAGGAAQLTGTNTYTGLTQIDQGGWLGLAGPGTITATSGVQANGTFDISRTWQQTNIPSLSGNGSVLLGNTTLSLFNASGTFSGQIADGGLGGGTGGKLLIAGGQETLSGNNTFTGATGIGAPAMLNLTGSLAGGVANLGTLVDDGQIGGTVLDAGLLTGNGNIGGDLAVSGTIAPGNAAGTYQTLNIAGNYEQQNGAVYLAQIDPQQPGTASLINVGGRATLDPGAGIGLAAVQRGIYHVGASYTVLAAAQGLSGTFTLSGNSMLSAVLGVTPSFDANHFYLDVAQEQSLTSIAGSANQMATLAGVQSLPTSSNVFAAVTSLPSDAALQAAGDQLSGEVHASTQGVLLQDSRYLRNAMSDRLRQAGEGAATGVGGPAMQVGDGSVTWWGQFVGAWGNSDANGNAAQLDYTTNGVLLGADRGVGGNAHVGVVGGYTQTGVDIGARASSASSRNLDLGVYAGLQLNAWGLHAGVANTWHRIASNRYLTVPGLVGHAQADYDANTTQAFGEASYRADLANNMFVEPFLRAAWVRLHADSFQEYGDDAGLLGASSHQSAEFSTLGARLAKSIALHGDASVTLHGMLGWRHAFDQIDTHVSEAFAGGTSFDVAGLPIAEDALAADAGVTFHVAQDASFDLSWQGQIARHSIGNDVNGRFDWRF
ncbi:MAG: autotransporter domain-containing protein [Proteobacteria bacterium]|nr:autotransporter domain-containing protein [Pseudomonadota bacterium]